VEWYDVKAKRSLKSIAFTPELRSLDGRITEKSKNAIYHCKRAAQKIYRLDT